MPINIRIFTVFPFKLQGFLNIYAKMNKEIVKDYTSTNATG